MSSMFGTFSTLIICSLLLTVALGYYENVCDTVHSLVFMPLYLYIEVIHICTGDLFGVQLKVVLYIGFLIG